MIPIKRNMLFFVAKEKDKEDGRLKCKIRWDRKIVEFNLGYRVDLDKWIKDAQSCKSNTTHGIDKIPASEINRAIGVMQDDISDIFYRYEVDEVIPTV